MTVWTVAYQAPPSMGFPRQEYWSGVPLPSLGAKAGRDIQDHGKDSVRYVQVTWVSNMLVRHPDLRSYLVGFYLASKEAGVSCY